jgi:hypothetical protein
MNKTLISLLIAALLTGCATGSVIKEQITNEQFDKPEVVRETYFTKPENKVLPPSGGPIPIAVYSFQDKTGQR